MVMAHNNHEINVLNILRKSFKSRVCCKKTAGISWEGVAQLQIWTQVSHFIICDALLRT